MQSTIDSALAQANLGFSEQIQQAAAQAIDGLLRGGNLAGARRARAADRARSDPPDAASGSSPASRPGTTRARARADRRRRELRRRRTSTPASRCSPTVGQPIEVKSTLLHGRRTPLNRFAVVVAVSVSLMFVGVLLAAGSVALEREERALARLLRGLVSRERAARREGAAGRGLRVRARVRDARRDRRFVALDWGRVGLWLVALAVGALAFGAVGVAIGALAREVRAASLLAFLAVAAAGLPGARARRPRCRAASTTRSAWSRSCSPSRPPCRRSTRRQRRLARDSASRSCTCSVLTLAFGALARVGSARAASSATRGRREASNLKRTMAFPQTRMRRLRASAGLRGLVRETDLRAGQLVLPLFVTAGSSTAPRRPRADRDDARRRAPVAVAPPSRRPREAAALGIAAVMLFGIPADKDEQRLGCVGRGGRRAARGARDQAGACPSCS